MKRVHKIKGDEYMCLYKKAAFAILLVPSTIIATVNAAAHAGAGTEQAADANALESEMKEQAASIVEALTISGAAEPTVLAASAAEKAVETKARAEALARKAIRTRAAVELLTGDQALRMAVQAKQEEEEAAAARMESATSLLQAMVLAGQVADQKLAEAKAAKAVLLLAQEQAQKAQANISVARAEVERQGAILSSTNRDYKVTPREKCQCNREKGPCWCAFSYPVTPADKECAICLDKKTGALVQAIGNLFHVDCIKSVDPKYKVGNLISADQLCSVCSGAHKGPLVHAVCKHLFHEECIRSINAGKCPELGCPRPNLVNSCVIC